MSASRGDGSSYLRHDAYNPLFGRERKMKEHCKCRNDGIVPSLASLRTCIHQASETRTDDKSSVIPL